MGSNSRKEVKMNIPSYHVQGIEFNSRQMILKINGKEFTFNLADISKRLVNASIIEKERYEISPSGYGIHWPLIDEDISIPGLLKTVPGLPQKEEVINAMAV
jgi:hypothetical protein